MNENKGQENQVLVIVALACSVLGWLLAWVPFVNLFGLILAVVGLLLGIILILMKQDRNKGRVHLTCFLSILAIVITLCVQLGFHHAHQIALSHANFKADAKPLKIGQDVTIDTDNYRVNSADFTQNIGNRVAQPGNKLLTISLTIKNLTKKDFGTGKGILPYTRDVFHLQANDQNVSFLTDQELPNALAEEGEVPVDSSLTANLYAEVPENSKVQLVYGTKPTDAKLRERVPSFIVQLN